MAEDRPPALRLPRTARLRLGHEFRRVKEGGKRMVYGCLIANWLVLPPGDTSKLGVISSRKIGGAVIRNRARRLMREAFRLNQLQLKTPVDMVLVGRASIVGKTRQEVERDYLTMLRRADLLKES
jgi:ribonuclease P protein component